MSKVKRMNPARIRFLQDCARVKAKLDEIREHEQRQRYYRPLRRLFKIIRRQVDPLDELLAYCHDVLCVLKNDPIAASIMPVSFPKNIHKKTS